VETRSQDEIGELAGAFNRMSADLARASQLRRQMTADIAHDLRTPLSLILAHAEALRDGVLPPAPETFTLIHDEATHLSRLVDDLRTLSLADAGELALNRRPSPPAELLERAVAKQMIRAQTHDVGLHTEAAPGLPLVNVDPDRMAQVLGNLLDNALRHTPGGGRVECRVTQTEAVRAVTFSVSDSGPGIAPEDLPHVFERLYRSDKSRRRDAPGSGLGLAIARSIIEAHGGRIWAESPPGQGAHFFVQVPGAAA
jgi:signal transduction histidine kinase